MDNLFSKDIFAKPCNALRSKAFFAFAFVLALIAAPDAAEAQSLGDMMCTVSRNFAPFEKLFVGLAYIGGAAMIGTGLSQLAFFSDTFSASKQYGIVRPKGLLIAGAGMLAMPAFIRLMVNTLFNHSMNADFGGGLSACVPYIGYGGFGDNVGLDGLMLNLVMNIKSPMVFMLSVISILVGIYLVMRGLIKASKYGTDPKTHSVSNILAYIVIGTILYTVGTSMNMVMATVFGDSSISGSGVVLSAIAANFGADTVPFQNGVYAALTFFQMIGMIAFIRGWLILKDAVEGQGQKTVAQGLTHILGGVLAINIYRFLEVMDTTFGTGFLS